MKVYVKVKTNSKEQKIEDFGDFRYLVYLKSRPENNEANLELIKAISKHLGVPSTHIKIKFGFTSENKILEVE